MAKQTSVTLTQEQKDAKTPAAFARSIGVDGKRLRDALRKQGVYVSKGDAFTDDHKVALLARFTK